MSEMCVPAAVNQPESADVAAYCAARSDWVSDRARQTVWRTLAWRVLKSALYQCLQSTPTCRRALARSRGRVVAAGGRTSQSAAAPRAYRADSVLARSDFGSAKDLQINEWSKCKQRRLRDE